MSPSRAVRLAAALSLAVAATAASAQTPESGRWSCTANGRSIDIQMNGEQMTVAYGAETRTLKRTTTRRGWVYTDGVVGVRFMEGDTRPTNDSKWLQNGQAIDFDFCQRAS